MIKSMCVGIGLLVAGCSGSQRSAETPPEKAGDETASDGSPTGTKLFREVDESKDKFEIIPAEGKGMAKYGLRLNGRSVWPPQGTGCDRLVQCCNELSASGDHMILACLLATAHYKECGEARDTAAAIAREKSHPMPQACNR